MGNIIIKNGRVFDGEKLLFTDILIKGDKIAKLKPNIKDNADYIYDANGKTVMPGLVDAHVHLSGGDYGAHPAMSTLPFGVTAVADAGVCHPKLLSNCGVNYVSLVNVEIKDNHADFTNTIKILKQGGNEAVGVKVYFDKEISGVKDISVIKEVVEFATKRGVIIMVHSSNPPTTMLELVGELRKGDIVTHAYHGGENNVADCNFECIRLAKNKGVIIDVGMAGHIHTDFAILESAILSGAIPDIISTDITRFSAYKRGGKYGLPMCMSIAKHLGMQEIELFKAVTSTPAKVLKKDSVWGCIKKGGKADICVLDYADGGFDLTDKAGNNISSSNGYQNALTIFNGEIVYIK